MTCSDRVPATLARALTAQGYHDLTPVQRAVLAVEPWDRDMLVSAPTGSGKTLAFGLALAPRLVRDDGRASWPAPRALVVAPTRELARQVAGALARLYAETGLGILCCTGGADLREERARLAAGCGLVVGTPGRLRDHIERGALSSAEIGAVVVDEADDMLDLGFREDLERLIDAAGPERQTLMFSATLSARAEALAARFQREAARIVAPRPEGGAPVAVRFEGVAVGHGEREAAVVNLLRFHEPQRAIVFCATRRAVAALAERLAARGFRVAALSGALTHAERGAALCAFRSGRVQTCVATDLAARGLDVPGLDLVIHADLPASGAALLHRSGRTGRGGLGGRVVLVVSPAQRRRAESLLRRAGLDYVFGPAPDRAAILARDEGRLCAETGAAPQPAPEERAAAARLIARHGAETVAVAYLRGHLRARPAPEAFGVRTAGPGARFADGVWFALEGAEPCERRRLLAFVCRLGGVARADVGAILRPCGERGAAVEIRGGAAAGFEGEARRAMPAGLRLRRLDGPPAR